MELVIACPSYKRPKVDTLKKYPHTRVYVAQSEYEDYCAVNAGADIVAVPDEVQGNLCRVRNYILDKEFESGTVGVLIIDDDMKAICRHEARGNFGYERHELDEAELYAFIEQGFRLCEEWGYRFWGVNCVNEPKAYFQQRPFNTTKYIGGPFQAHLKNDIRYDEELPLKEDYDMTLQHFLKWGGGVAFQCLLLHLQTSGTDRRLCRLSKRERRAKAIRDVAEKVGQRNYKKRPFIETRVRLQPYIEISDKRMLKGKMENEQL